jgi:hypothetical protein
VLILKQAERDESKKKKDAEKEEARLEKEKKEREKEEQRRKREEEIEKKNKVNPNTCILLMTGSITAKQFLFDAKEEIGVSENAIWFGSH